MKGKKEKAKVEKTENQPAFEQISSKSDLKQFLLAVRDGMAEEQVPTLYAMSAMNHLLNLPDIYQLLDNENKELARDIWLRLKQSGLQIRNPKLLFEPDDDTAVNP